MLVKSGVYLKYNYGEIQGLRAQLSFQIYTCHIINFYESSLYNFFKMILKYTKLLVLESIL